MSEVNENINNETEQPVKIGFCSFCGQGHQYPDVTIDCEQSDLDELATNECNCSEAKSFRRQRERREKINHYIDHQFNAEVREAARDIVEIVEKQSDWLQADIKTVDGWKITIKTNKDGYLVISRKKTVTGQGLIE